MRVKEGKKVGLKLYIQKMIMASCPITFWQIEGEKVEAVIRFYLGYKISKDSDFSHEIKLAPWKKSYDKLRQHIKK